jgi:hypothetical protein
MPGISVTLSAVLVCLIFISGGTAGRAHRALSCAECMAVSALGVVWVVLQWHDTCPVAAWVCVAAWHPSSTPCVSCACVCTYRCRDRQEPIFPALWRWALAGCGGHDVCVHPWCCRCCHVCTRNLACIVMWSSLPLCTVRRVVHTFCSQRVRHCGFGRL